MAMPPAGAMGYGGGVVGVPVVGNVMQQPQQPHNVPRPPSSNVFAPIPPPTAPVASPRPAAARPAAPANPISTALSNSLAELLKSILLREFALGEQLAMSTGDHPKAQAYMDVQHELKNRSTSELKDIFTNMSPLISGPEKSTLLNKVMEEYKRKEAIVRAQYQTAQVQQAQAQQAAAAAASNPPPTKKQRVHDGDGPDNARATAQADEADELKTDVTDMSGINLNEEQATLVPSLRSASADGAPMTPSPISSFNRYLVERKLITILRQAGLEGKDAGVTEYVLHALYDRMVNILNQAMDISQQRASGMQKSDRDLLSSDVKPFLIATKEAEERRWKEAELRRASSVSEESANHSAKEAESMRETAMRMLGASSRRNRPTGSTTTEAAQPNTKSTEPTSTAAPSATSNAPQRKITRKDMLLLMERDPHLRSSRNTHEIFLGIAPRKIMDEPINLLRPETGDVPVLPPL
eukprot:TRINITY_DN2837_c0_g1_i1.p1 TRINITY_DN2837_c0_g1~~TRINITY_DN2837_c0_g1_i1.p1  ORF type:complete len:511 (-),score=101.34 TRINITY_DN2837_c0_g1_i1:44-1447(-)